MYYDSYKIERIVIEILNKLGKEVDVKANLKTWSDRDSYIYGDLESYKLVKGLRYHFDKMTILGYHYNNNYYFSVNYGSWWQKPYGRYAKKEDGQIINENEEIWKPYFLELFTSLDNLVNSQKEREYFFKNYGGLIPWKKFSGYWSEEETKNYIKELNITLVANQFVTYGGNDSAEAHQSYKIFDGTNCVYDSVKNFFIPGQWQWKLAEYILDKKKTKDLLNSMQTKKSFDDSIQLLQKLKKQ